MKTKESHFFFIFFFFLFFFLFKFHAFFFRSFRNKKISLRRKPNDHMKPKENHYYHSFKEMNQVFWMRRCVLLHISCRKATYRQSERKKERKKEICQNFHKNLKTEFILVNSLQKYKNPTSRLLKYFNEI